MAKFNVFGKKVFVDDKLVKAFEEFQGFPFEDHTAGHLVETGGGTKDTPSIEMTRLIKEGIEEYFEVYEEVVKLIPEMEKMANE